MKKYLCLFVICAFLSLAVDTHSQELPQPVLELSGTVLSRTKTEFRVYERVKVGFSRTHTFKITADTIFYGLVVPGVFVTVRFTQKMLRPGLFVRTAVEVKGISE